MSSNENTVMAETENGNVPVELIVDEPTADEVATTRLNEFVAMGGSFAKVAAKALELMSEENEFRESAKTARKEWKKRLRNLEKVHTSLNEETE